MSVEKDAERKPGITQGLFLTLGSCLSMMALVVLAPVLPQLMVVFRDVPNANVWVPALVSVPALGAALFSPFSGLLGDRFGRRIPLIGFSVAFSIAGALPLILDDFLSIFLTRILVGIAYMGVLVLSTAMTGDYFSGAAGDRWLAAQAVAATLSSLILTALSGFLSAGLGWRGPFIIFLLGLPLAMTYAILFREPASRSQLSAARVPWSALPWAWLTRVCLMSAFFAVLFNALQLQLGLALASLGITDSARIGLLSAIALTGIPAGAFVFMKLTSYPFLRLLRLELLVLGATLIVMRYTGDYRVFLVMACINLMACGMTLPTLLIHITRHLDTPMRARGIGIWQSALGAGQFLSVGVSGLIMRRAQATVFDAFWVLGMSALVVMAFTPLIMNTRRKSELAASG